jgi:hypothetical protein
LDVWTSDDACHVLEELDDARAPDHDRDGDGRLCGAARNTSAWLAGRGWPRVLRA